MSLLSLSILRDGNTIRGNWNNIPVLPKTNLSLMPPPALEARIRLKAATLKYLSNRGLLTLCQTSSGPLCFDELQTMSSPGQDEVVQSMLEQLIVEGVAKTGRKGSVCQAAGWGYPWLTTLPPRSASSNAVNEIPSLAQLADIQWREKGTERGLDCVFIWY